jgi:release factor glutamine methyltransferase
LARAGVPGARDEAMAIWAVLAGATPGDVWLARDRDATPEEIRAFRSAVERRAEGVPVAYAVGSAGFRTLTLQVDSRVLIPRPETEGLVEHALLFGRSRGDAPGAWGRALDVGTGSGCVALSLAVEGRFQEVVATDVSGDALTLARQNLQAVAPPTPVRLRQGALFEPVKDETFTVIAANPPYLTEAEFEQLEPGVREHEPREALVSGPDGMEHIRMLLSEGRAHLEPGGLLVLEVDCARAEAARAVANAAGWRDATIERDLFGRDRYLLAIGAE